MKKKYNNLIAVTVIVVFIGILSFHIREESYIDFVNCRYEKKFIIYGFLKLSKKTKLTKLNIIFSKYQITCNKNIYLGYRIHSLYSRGFDRFSSSRIKLLSMIYLIDESSKIPFDKKKKYIENLLIPLNKNDILFETNLMKIRKLYFDDKI